MRRDLPTPADAEDREQVARALASGRAPTPRRAPAARARGRRSATSERREHLAVPPASSRIGRRPARSSPSARAARSSPSSTASRTRLHGLGADQHLARLGRLLEPRRDVDGVARREPLRRCRSTTSPVLTPMRPLDAELGERVAHLDRRPAGAQGVVLVHDGDAEDGHHRVADELLDACRRGARRSPSSARSSDASTRAQRLGIGRLPQRGRAGDVAEEDRHGLALLTRAPGQARPARHIRGRTSLPRGSRGRTRRRRSRAEATTSSARPPSARPRSASCRPRSRGPRAPPSCPAPCPRSRR